ncbi:MAG: DPP IV N-terminal domain-containing protein [Edaphobacter sp.]|uniref:S9 family peptidase n=1 Tax=Edaphobacter sp. TaxID=1934404 RepID=UPI00239FF9B5|nr:DPP IV N-terminal domain-containing protein [Edaphobacter sp.]MDE1176893.1 DPP IV N-terminal domain-containing protein [Edaphobacter sp.]
MASGKLLGVGGVLCLMGATAMGEAQQPRQLTDADYARAESFMNYNVNALVYHSVEKPQWLGDGRFWYRDYAGDGTTFLLVDPVKKTKGPAFDQQKLATALTAAMQAEDATGHTAALNVKKLPVTEFALSDGDKVVTVLVHARHWRCDLSGAGQCVAMEKKSSQAVPYDLSPDGKKAAFIRDWNLWVRDVETGAETQLTTDGVKDYGYATDNAGWSSSDRPILVWSPDSKKIATFQQDQRKTGEMYLVPVTNTHPQLKAWKYPLVGDKDVTMIERVIVDVDAAKVTRLKMAPDQHRSMLCDDISCEPGGPWEDVQWSDDGKQLAFVSTSRDHKQEWVRMADVATGEVREVMTETAPKFFEPGNGRSNWKWLWQTNEFLWFSERDGWGQMYLYDGATGKQKSQLTRGDGNVTEMLLVDAAKRKIYFRAVGKEQGRDPYFQSYYSVNFDGTGMKLLTPENADHAIAASPDGRYFVDVASTTTEPQTTVVRSTDGALTMEVAKQDIRDLKAMGWVPPTPITVKGRDGKTDLYGFLFKPTDFDATKKYPIVNNVYPGPQTGSCGGRSFTASHRDMQSLAELGFVVVCIDGMGTPWRSKAFHEFYYGNLGDNTIPDQVAGMKELAKKYPWIDIDKVGMYGHSGGGNATAAAMFNYPDFFKVGIAESGNHDQRDYEDDWAERWAGLEVKNADGTSNYDSQANQNIAKNLKGKLLLAHGTMDNNVPPNNTLLVVDALIKANKDFDLLMIPNVPHGYQAASLYMMRRRWDYFVKNLAGETPPKEYRMKSWHDAETALRGGGPQEE